MVIERVVAECRKGLCRGYQVESLRDRVHWLSQKYETLPTCVVVQYTSFPCEVFVGSDLPLVVDMTVLGRDRWLGLRGMKGMFGASRPRGCGNQRASNKGGDESERS